MPVAKKTAILGALISLLTGCAEKRSISAEKPGVSQPLKYPVLLIGERDLKIKDNEVSLTTTTVASGGVFHTEYRLIDATGADFEIRGAAAVDPRKHPMLDMGTLSFRLYLQLGKKTVLSIDQARARVLASIQSDVTPAARTRINQAKSMPELIEACRTYWL